MLASPLPFRNGVQGATHIATKANAGTRRGLLCTPINPAVIRFHKIPVNLPNAKITFPRKSREFCQRGQLRRQGVTLSHNIAYDTSLPILLPQDLGARTSCNGPEYGGL